MDSSAGSEILIAIVGTLVSIVGVIVTLYVFWKTKAASELDRRFNDTKSDFSAKFDEFSRRLQDAKESNTREHQMVCDRLDELKTEVNRLDLKVDEGLTRVHDRMDQHLNLHVANDGAVEMPARRGRPRKVVS